MVEREICAEDYPEGDLELRRELCVVRFMFRCSLCDGDYVSKEGLWNHLDLHEIADESKEWNYQEIKAKHKLHQCVLCNDQRVYSESSYWKHIQDIHDGFFLRCFDCGENFRSEQLKNDHAFSHCMARDKTVALALNAREAEAASIEVKIMPSDAEHLKLSRGEESLDLPSQFVCDICGQSFPSKGFLLRHKRSKYACFKACMMQKCLLCGRVFQVKEHEVHFPLCEKKRKIPCELCPMKFEFTRYRAMHMKNVHHRKGVPKTEKQDPNQGKDIMKKTIKMAEKTTKLSGPEIIVFSLDSSSGLNVVEDRDVSTTKKDTPDNCVQLLVENPSSTSSGTKCTECGKECVTGYNLRQHISRAHQLIKCNICGITLKGYTQARHHKVMKHTKIKYECANCSKKFYCSKLHKLHSTTCVPIKSDLSNNKKSFELIEKDSSDPQGVTQNDSREASCTKCSHCAIEESSAVALARHILMHHDPVACDFCGITLSSLSDAQHHMTMIHKESNLKCPHCSMRFPSTERLQQHVSHCENEKVPCDFCGKMFGDEIAVLIHRNNACRAYVKSKEEAQQSAETSLCNETDSSGVKENISPPLIGRGLSEKKCYYCDEEFSSPGYLILHLKISHQLTKCDICDITVIGISSIKKHKIKYHREAKYKCISCGETFHRRDKYEVHSIVCHNFMDSQVVSEKISQPRNARNSKKQPYSCNICGSTQYSYNKIRHHMLTKHTEAKFQCPHCSIKFHYKASLKYHMSCCRDLKHSCELCGHKFHALSRLKNHKKRVHHCNSPLRIAKLTCLKHVKEHDEPQFGAEEISPKEVRTNSTIVPQAENIELKLEIKAEDTVLQEDPGRSFNTTLQTYPKHAKACDHATEEIPLFHGVIETETNSTIVPQGENIKLKHDIKVEEPMLQE